MRRMLLVTPIALVLSAGIAMAGECPRMNQSVPAVSADAGTILSTPNTTEVAVADITPINPLATDLVERTVILTAQNELIEPGTGGNVSFEDDGPVIFVDLGRLDPAYVEVRPDIGTALTTEAGLVEDDSVTSQPPYYLVFGGLLPGFMVPIDGTPAGSGYDLRGDAG